MQVNLCHRLIKKQIEEGNVYVVSEPNKCPKLCHDDIPLGLYTTNKYYKDNVIRELHGKLLLEPTMYSIHIGHGLHVEDDYGKYINHSFDPNTKIILNKVVALRDIDPYEEITFNYNDSEINMAHPFTDNGIEVSGKNINN